MPSHYVIGLDMGGTNIRCAAVSPSGRVMLLRRAPSEAGASAPAVASNIAAQIRALEDAARRRGMGRARAIGVAVPGPLDVYRGVVMAAPHVKAWRGFPLRARLEAELGRHVVVENDANAWALGEFWRGAARGHRDVVLLTLGTGIGGGLIVGGKIVHGRSGMAGELGHITVEPEGMPCDCGSRGCVEAYASSSGMRALVARRLGARKRMPAQYLDRDGNFSVRAMTCCARAHDRLALETFSIAGSYLGIAIASLLNIFNPDLIVIGGGVAGALPHMRKAMTAEVRARAFVAIAAQARIVRAALGPIGGVVGAAYAAINPVRRQG
ncbi:MAG TPA: ROK family protein [Candidatus Binataceae bacterium]|nr:ROK family protein [Candidatus Binataceae bacterium]